MRIAICDDELQYRQLIHEKLLQDSICCDYETEISEYESAAELLAATEKGYSADVFFLDIQMSGGEDGIWVGRELRRRGERGLIVYITGFIDYVQIGYEVRAFRYLLKGQINESLPRVLGDIRRELSGSSYFFQAGRESLRVEKRNILYLESRIRILRLVTAEREYSFYDNLEHAARELGESFLRCHRSFLVNMDRIRKYSSNEIVLEGDITIPISRSYGKAVKQRLMLEMK